MRLCTLLSSYEQASSPFRDVDPYLAPHLWAPEHSWETVLVEKVSAVRTVRALARRGFDAFVNLCDGSLDEEQAGVEVTRELERLGVAFTGTDARLFEPSRQSLKLVCEDVGVESPRFLFAASREEAEQAAGFRFPLLVKPTNGYGSVGITARSRVSDVDALLIEVDRMIDEHGGALIEEFVEGREFTALVLEAGEGDEGPRAYAPLEIGFPPGETFKHFDLKWRGYESLGAHGIDDADLAARIERAVALVFQGYDAVGYARFDVRMDGDGRLFVIDINTTPGVFYPPEAPGSADLILTRSPGGHRAFLDHIVGCATRRRDAQARRWTLRHDLTRGCVAVALRDLSTGERVHLGEGRSHRLVTGDHRAVTARGYALSRDVRCVGSDDLEGRFPVAPSSDPNLARAGLDFVARRPIAKGEVLTADLIDDAR